jgi:hypothetical protein
MAGKGKKTFVAGEVLLAQDVNDYLMDQSVMNFATSAARSSAIPTPTEGMFTVTTDNDQLDYYNGSAWVSAVPIGAWKTWSPTLLAGWANGNGVWTARYAQIGKTVICSAEFIIGSTTTIGANLQVSLPVDIAVNNQLVNSSCRLNAAGIAAIGAVHQAAAGTVGLFAMNAAGTYVIREVLNTTVPNTWAATNIISFSLVYEGV